MNARILPIAFALAAAACLPLAAQDKPDALKTYRLGRDLEAQGRAAEAAQRYTEAEAICKEEIAQNSANLDSYTVLSWTLLRQKKYRETIEWAAKGLKVNAADYRLVESQGEAHFYLDDYPASLKAMQRYVDGAPQGERVSVAYFFMGEIYRIQRKNLSADIAYSAAVNLEPNIALWWYRLGLVREAAGEPKSARAALERALALNPSYKDASDVLERVKKAGA